MFRTANADGADDGNLVEKINSCIRNSRVFSKLSPPPRALPSPTAAVKDGGDAATLPIRWRKGEMIGCGAFGQVYMGMNLDSGELLAVKQVFIVVFAIFGFGLLNLLIVVESLGTLLFLKSDPESVFDLLYFFFRL